MPEVDGLFHLWVESYNVYQLIDGYEMKEYWGDFVPEIMFSEKNLQAIADQIKWALLEDELDAVNLSPRFRRIRFKGGSYSLPGVYNGEMIDEPVCTVNAVT